MNENETPQADAPELELSEDEVTAMLAEAEADAAAEAERRARAAQRAERIAALRVAADREAEALAVHVNLRDEAITAFAAQWDADHAAPAMTATELLAVIAPPAPPAPVTRGNRRSTYNEAHAEAWLRAAIANPPMYDPATKTLSGDKPLNVHNMYDAERAYRATGASVNHDAFTDLRVDLLAELAA